jgi:uncharacterized protein
MKSHRSLKTCAAALLVLLLAPLTAVSVAALDVPPSQGPRQRLRRHAQPGQRSAAGGAADRLRAEGVDPDCPPDRSFLAGDSLEDFSIRVAEAWKIGQEDTDNGAILLIAKADRKIRIEVGYGLEGRLTDLLAGRIIRNVIAPALQGGRV